MTLVVASLGLLLSLVSLGWQMWSWRNTGPRVRVSATNMVLVHGSDIGDHHVAVIATNRGRSAVTVTGWGIEFPNEDWVTPRHPIIGSTPLPHRLEPQSAANFYMLAEQVRRVCTQKGASYTEVQPFVQLATGGRVRCRGVKLD